MAPGKNESEMSLRIWRLGGTTLPTRFIVKTYCAMAILSGDRSGEAKPVILTDRGFPSDRAGARPPIAGARKCRPRICQGPDARAEKKRNSRISCVV